MIDYETYCRIRLLAEQKQLKASQIAAELHLDIKTVEKWMQKQTFQLRQSQKRSSKLDAFKTRLSLCWIAILTAVREHLLSLAAYVIGGAVLMVVGVFLRFNGRYALRIAVAALRHQPAKPRTTAEPLEQLRSIDWFQFEKLVGLVYRKQCYVVTRRGGANPDGGIDLVIEKDGQRAGVQWKQWKSWNVGVRVVREFLGALTDAEIKRGILVTLRDYTGEAKQLAEKHGIQIINQTGLERMLESTDARFDPEAHAILRDSRKLCPKCEREMVLRRAGRGAGVGREFWGCSTYPHCRFTMPV